MTADNERAVEPLIGTALATLRRGDARGALTVLVDAEKNYPRNLNLKLNLALVRRTLADFQGALAALDQALAIDPYFFLALLSKGSVLEQMGQARRAAEIYRNALEIAPPPGQTPPSLVEPIRHARELVNDQAEALAIHLREKLGGLYAQHKEEPMARFDECLDVFAGTKRIYNSNPIQLQVPRLPAIPFFDREYFPWLPQLEAATDTIRDELHVLLEAGMPGFAPYIQYAPGTPVNQFEALNHSRLWSTLWLWKDGEAQQEPIARCPKTAAILAELPLADQPGFAPTALFSALAPNTRIPPHTGSTNARLLVHLPLILPGPAGFRVGNDTREWRIGEAWAFDDTIEHEAWNDSDETRVILIFDIWNPLLSEAERELVTALLLEHRQWLADSNSP
jgi:aspartyl/asparaginyl beta-hydroxylase (cupin superfamily)